jgi:hypothetical protein
VALRGEFVRIGLAMEAGARERGRMEVSGNGRERGPLGSEDSWERTWLIRTTGRSLRAHTPR